MSESMDDEFSGSVEYSLDETFEESEEFNLDDNSLVLAESGEVFIAGPGECDESRSLLSIFDLGELTTGISGVTFPPHMIDGDCPISAAIIKGSENTGFGGPLNDF